ncbi:MAG: ribonuclease III [Rhodospirillaceae bacterium]
MSAAGRPELEAVLGHAFANPDRLDQALTHSSAVGERVSSNERLEFLGDRVLGLVVAEMLYTRFQTEEEGDLGYRFTALVRREALARVAREIGLGRHIRMSEGERDTGGAEKDGVLANACEAVIAAIYLDGGFGPAAGFVRRYWEALLDEAPEPQKDPKTVLQEWAQATGRALPAYNVVDRQGPDHAPVFEVEVQLSGEMPARGSGNAKRAAEQAAAAAMLERVENKRGRA